MTNEPLTGLLADLRTLRPHRHLTYDEARSIAERQAQLLVERLGADLPVGLDHLIEVPRLKLFRDGNMPDHVAGSSHWTGEHWLIALNRRHPEQRQRFTAFHELHHIIDHPFRRFDGTSVAEVLADHFSACVLMPRTAVKRAWGSGIQNVPELASLFEVSVLAMRVRLVKLGLVDPTRRSCDRSRRYFRLASGCPAPTPQGGALL